MGQSNATGIAEWRFLEEKAPDIYNKYVGFTPGMEELWEKDIEKLLK